MLLKPSQMCSVHNLWSCSHYNMHAVNYTNIQSSLSLCLISINIVVSHKSLVSPPTAKKISVSSKHSSVILLLNHLSNFTNIHKTITINSPCYYDTSHVSSSSKHHYSIILLLTFLNSYSHNQLDMVTNMKNIPYIFC